MIVYFYDNTGRVTAKRSGAESELRRFLEDSSNLCVLGDANYKVSDCYYDFDLRRVLPKGDKPSDAYTFNLATKSWELDLSLAKASKWNEIKSARNDEEFGTFDSLGYTFQSDEVSQRRLQGAVQLSQMDATLVMDWTLADNTVQSFTAAEYIQIGVDLAAHVNAAHIKSRQLRTQIDAATTETEVNAVTW